MTDGKHGGSVRRKIAEENCILLTQVGSGAHGISVAGTDDRDEMGICIEPREYVIGLQNFEQYEHHTAWEREGGLANRSGPGDLDIVIYSLRKYMRLALNGNPSILVPLFVDRKDVVHQNWIGSELRRTAERFASKQAGYRFLGYLHAQRERMLSHNGKGRDVTRPELIEKYGYDTKYAGHMVRLGLQGIEYMQTGRLTLPMNQKDREDILDIRVGVFSMEQALAAALRIEHNLRVAIEESSLPERPDYDMANAWLIDAYEEWWDRSDQYWCGLG